MGEKLPSRGEIFVVDDDPAVRETLSIVLSAGGYEVICFADGAALLAVARNRTPACILLDVHIPGKSGLDILKELHGEDYPAPIFIISGQGDIAMAVTAIKTVRWISSRSRSRAMSWSPGCRKQSRPMHDGAPRASHRKWERFIFPAVNH